MRGARGYFVMLLLVLASALAAALVPSGSAPASRHQGSAFDPSTSAVALRVRAQRAEPRAEERALPPRPRGRTEDIAAGAAGMDHRAVLAAAVLLLGGRAVPVRACVSPHLAPCIPLPRSFVATPGPRAPPSANV